MFESIDDYVILDYYDGAYGPTIRVATYHLECLRRIRDLFMGLAVGQLQSAELDDAVTVKVSGMKSLHLKRISEERVLSKTLEIVGHQSEGPKFIWGQSAAGWEECAGLVEGIIANNRPGHQYLTIEGIDDAIVEVSYKE